MYPGRLKNVKDGKQYSLQCSGLGWKKCAHQHGNVVFVARRQCTSFTAQIVDQQPTIVKNAAHKSTVWCFFTSHVFGK